MTAPVLSEQAKNELRALLEHQLTIGKLTATTTPTSFCGYYATARPIVVDAEGFISMFAGLGGIWGEVATALKVVVTVGDQLCPPS